MVLTSDSSSLCVRFLVIVWVIRYTLHNVDYLITWTAYTRQLIHEYRVCERAWVPTYCLLINLFLQLYFPSHCSFRLVSQGMSEQPRPTKPPSSLRPVSTFSLPYEDLFLSIPFGSINREWSLWRPLRRLMKSFLYTSRSSIHYRTGHTRLTHGC